MFNKVVLSIKRLFENDQVIKEKCNHYGQGKLTRIDSELVMCEDCHRTFRIGWGLLGMEEIKLGKKHLDKILNNRRTD